MTTEQAEARIAELHASLERTNESYIAAEKAAEQAHAALQQIMHYPFDVNSDSVTDLQAVKEIARAALAGNKT